MHERGVSPSDWPFHREKRFWLLETKGPLGIAWSDPSPLADGNRSPEMDSAPPVTRRPAYRLATACDLSPRKGSKAGFQISALKVSAQK